MHGSFPERARASRVLLPVAPFSLDLALEYLASSPSAVLEVIADGVFRRALTLPTGRDVLIELRTAGSEHEPKPRLDVLGEGVKEDDVRAAEGLVRRMFRLDEDPAGFEAVLAGDPVLARVVESYRGLRPVLIAEPFEALMWAILGQQVNVAFARKLKLALVNLVGRSLDVDGCAYPLMPRPREVAALDPALLTASQFSRQKTSYVIALAEAVASGALDFDEIEMLPHDEAIARLTAFRGVGRWTAEYVLMRGLGARDSLPAADIGLRAIIGRAYGLGRHATEIEVRQLGERWAGWRSWAAFYWWRALQAGTWFSPHR